MALKLIYQMFAKLLGWMVLHTRSDACGCRELGLWVPRTLSSPLNSTFTTVDHSIIFPELASMIARHGPCDSRT